MVTYGRPNMAAMPRDVGRIVLEAIRNTPPIDYERMHQEAVAWEKNAAILIEKQGEKYHGHKYV